jgi:chromosome segregation protein
MYLRSIVLKGFKSFPERTRLEFGPGVSVIVGPNGSGKSNVTDAVLWALGEQSPVAVRGQAMQDVIFSGAPGRQASRAAEVELVLDDSEGSLGLGTPEVSIARRLDRTGEGEYRLAGARCRLVDVIEVLSDTGLGKEMHSVISQGRVESLVTSKPRDRRLLIEEAAGLGKHRKRRRRAQLKLERTQDNLDRALDVEREARTRLRPLKRQAEAAELHARLERQALEARWELTRDELRSRLEILQQAQIAASAARARREQVERELEAVARRREAAEEALAGRSAHRDELSRRCFVARSASDRVADRTAALRSTAGAVQARLDRAQRHLAALEQPGEDETLEAAARLRITELAAQLEELEREREGELERALAGLESERSVAAGRTAEREAAMEAAQQARDAAEQALAAARAAVLRSQQAVEEARVEAARVGGELAAVNQFLRSHAGAPGDAPLLADQLEVDPGYELAVAAALDGRLRAAVVADRSTADSLLDRAGPEGGRALIAEFTEGEPAAVRTPPASGAEPLARHVQGAGPAAQLARSLLRHTWLVSSLSGLESGFDGVAVTAQGRVLSIAGAELRQAPAMGEERVLEERNRREQLIGESERAASAELASLAALESARSEHHDAEAGVQGALESYRAATRERDDAAEEERRIGSLIERRRAAPDEGPGESRRRGVAAELRAEEEALVRRHHELEQRRRQIAALGNGVAAHSALVPELERLLGSLEEAALAIDARRTWFEQELADDSEAGEHLAAELRECAHEEAPLQAQLHRLSEDLTEQEVALQRARDRVEEGEHELGCLAGRLGLEAVPAEQELPPEQREALEVRLERLARRREQLGPVNPLAEQEYADAVAHVEELERQRTDLEDALRELQKLIADTDRQIRETFEQTFHAAAANFEQVVAQLFPGGHGRLRLVADREGPAPVLGGQAPEASEDEGDADSESAAAEAARSPEEDLLGVEIEINPAGKEMRRLSLLSGGEKSLTALAFLFAVFLARPCPFYILDEVEAALDDLNIDRFLGLLRAYSSHAQFIVVTHQRRTMEAADFLYGVSMGGDGVSKVISRRLPRSDSAAEDAAEGDAMAQDAADGDAMAQDAA